MKVGLFTYGMLGGGIENLLLNLAIYLRYEGTDVTIVTTEVKGGWYSKLEESKISSHHIEGLEYESPVAHVKKVAQYINQSGYDVVFINNARFVQASIPLLDKNIAVIPIIHNNDILTYQINSYYKSRCFGYVAVSPLIHKELLKRFPNEKVYLIPNGINEGIYSKERNMFNSIDNDIKLLYVGRLYHEEKGILFLPRILKEISLKYNNVSLEIIGSGPDEEKLRKNFDMYGVTEKVKFLGMLPTKKVYEYMCEAHILLFPSLREGFGLVLAEAQLFGCVPIASNIKDVTDYIINDNENGFLVEMGDVKSFVSNIILLIENRHVLKCMSENAKKNALKNFTLKSFGNKYCELIKEIKKSSMTYPKIVFDLETTIKILASSKNKELTNLYDQWIRKLYLNDLGITCSLNTKGIKNVAIFGTLKTALLLLQDLKKASINVVAFLDNNKDLHGENISGISIFSPERFLIDYGYFVDLIILSIESEHDKDLIEDLGKYIDKNRIISWKSFFIKLPG